MTPTGMFSEVLPELQFMSAMNAGPDTGIADLENTRLRPGSHQPMQPGIQSGWQVIGGSLRQKPSSGLERADWCSALPVV